MGSPLEKTLLARAQEFDLQTLAEIYDRYSPGLYAYSYRLLSDDCLAEDCVADTFSRFLHALRAGNGPRDSLQAYLYRIAHNWITDHYRRTPAPLPLDEDLYDRRSVSPESAATENWQIDQVRSALRNLTPDQRQVVMLKFIEGWENETIALSLQKPVGAVKSLQHRALASLRRMLLPKQEIQYENPG